MAYVSSWFATQLFALTKKSLQRKNKMPQWALAHESDWSNSGIIQKELARPKNKV